MTVLSAVFIQINLNDVKRQISLLSADYNNNSKNRSEKSGSYAYPHMKKLPGGAVRSKISVFLLRPEHEELLSYIVESYIADIGKDALDRVQLVGVKIRRVDL